MIGSNLKIKNHLGFNNYLREDNNLYFLVDDATAANYYTSCYYSSNPMYDESYNNNDKILKDYYNEDTTINRLYKLLFDNKNSPENVKKILLNCDQSISIDWIEMSYLDHSIEDSLSSIIYKIFKNIIKIIKINDTNIPVNFYNKNQLRIFRNNEWIDASDEEEEEIIKKRVEQIANIKKKFGYYAFVDEKGIFKIKEVAPIQFTKKGDIDNRISRELGALKCGTGKLAKGGLIYRIMLISLKALEFNNITPLLENLHKTGFINPDSKEYINNLKPYIVRYLVERDINNVLLKLDNENRRKVFTSMYETMVKDREDSQLILRSIIQADTSNEDLYLNDDNIKTIIRDLEDITFLKKRLNILDNQDDISFINKLPDDTRQTLSKSLKYKANTLCESLKLWFEENNLSI